MDVNARSRARSVHIHIHTPSIPPPPPHRSNGIGGCLKRLSVRSVQAFFFPLAYIGFLAALGLLLLTVLLGALVLMANQACTAGNST